LVMGFKSFPDCRLDPRARHMGQLQPGRDDRPCIPGVRLGRRDTSVARCDPVGPHRGRPFRI
jgi:hypothetical protein